MQIIKTRPELEAAVGLNSVGYTGLSRKTSGDELHPGHANLIQFAKSNYDLSVVSFWDALELVYEFYDHEYFLDNIGMPWDSTGVLAWCEAQGVDYVLLPDQGYSAEYVASLGIDKSAAKSMVNQIWSSNNYPTYNFDTQVSQYNNMILAKTFVIMQNYKNQFNNIFVSSWKDGFPKFTNHDYVKYYTTEDSVLLAPIKSPDGLYYSSNYPYYTEDQKNLIKQIEGVVNNVGYADTNVLLAALNDLNTDEGFEAYRVDITYGGVVGAANDFLNIMFTVEGNGDTYPIYKKGVR